MAVTTEPYEGRTYWSEAEWVDEELANLYRFAVRAGRGVAYFLAAWVLAGFVPVIVDSPVWFAAAIGLIAVTRIGNYVAAFALALLILAMFVPPEALFG